MLTVARTLSSSQKLKHPLFLSLSLLAQSLKNPSSSCSSCSSVSQTQNPQSQSSIILPRFNPFCSFSSIPSFPFTRDGNYDEATSHVVCPGCGVHMQDSDPKHPGFFLKPTEKSSSYRSRLHLVPVAYESEFPSSLKKGLLVGTQAESEAKVEIESETAGSERPVVCARCHSLRNYGKVKDPTVENLLPDFDFDHTIGRRLASAGGTRSVVLMVVDAADFDGSFPRKVARLVSETIEENRRAWKEGKPANLPRVVVVLTKIDLLPSALSPTGLEYWARRRTREGGASKITSLHMVSAVKDWGLKGLVEEVVRLAGSRGCVWAVGAQNAGKSTLINAMGKSLGGKISHLTEAPVPGTTLGIVRVEGILPGQAKLFDTPGLLHPHQITTRLTSEEQRLVHISKELKPRTYRIKAGYTIHIAGLMRLDLEESSVESIYVTVWASPYLPLHMGKTENAERMLEEHFGNQLQPPIGEKRVEELGKWVRREFRVCGNNWNSSSMDVAASGLGWFAVGLKGEAVLGVWTYEGVDVVLRDSLIPYRSNDFEVTGFTVSKIVAKADQAQNKQRQKAKKKKQSPKPSVMAESSVLAVDTDSNSC